MTYQTHSLAVVSSIGPNECATPGADDFELICFYMLTQTYLPGSRVADSHDLQTTLVPRHLTFDEFLLT